MRIAGWTGFVGGLLCVAVIALVCTWSGYCLGPSDAISDLGMPGQPHAIWINVGALIMPGLMVGAFAAGYARHASRPIDRLVGAFLILGAIGWIVAGAAPFPDTAHFVGVAGAGVGFGLGIFSKAFARGDPVVLRAVSATIGLGVLGNVLTPVVPFAYPGHYQKLTFCAGILWLVMASLHLTQSTPRPDP